jgi:hypothetical protein
MAPLDKVIQEFNKYLPAEVTYQKEAMEEYEYYGEEEGEEGAAGEDENEEEDDDDEEEKEEIDN